MPRPIQPPPHSPDRSATALLRRLHAYAETTEDTTRQEHEDRIVSLQHMWLEAYRLWEDAMVAGRHATGSRKVSLNRVAEITGAPRSSIQTYLRRAERRHEEAA